MGSKTRLSSYCTKRDDNTVNLVTLCKINTRLARPFAEFMGDGLAVIGRASLAELFKIKLD